MGTLTPVVARVNAIQDGMDGSVRFYLKQNDDTQTYQASWKMINPSQPTNPDYWGLQVYTVADSGNPGHYLLEARFIWSLAGVAGVRDLAPTAGNYPRLATPLASDMWYRIWWHTSPDGRIALELSRDVVYPLDQKQYIQLKSGDPAEVNGPIPSFPTGQNWTFEYTLQTNTQAKYVTLLDDYSEHRTIYAQTDTVYNNQPPISATSRPDLQHYLVGTANNCDGMAIRYTPATNGWNTTYATLLSDIAAGKHTQTRTSYTYDSYGNPQDVLQFGDVSTQGDERMTTTSHVVVNTATAYMVSRVAQVDSLSGITTTTLLARSVSYYDGNTSPGVITGAGDLTKALQRGVTGGAEDGTSTAQQFTYDSYGNPLTVQDANSNTTTTEFDDFYHSFPITTTYANGSKAVTRYDYTLDVANVMTDVNGLVTL